MAEINVIIGGRLDGFGRAVDPDRVLNRGPSSFRHIRPVEQGAQHLALRPRLNVPCAIAYNAPSVLELYVLPAPYTLHYELLGVYATDDPECDVLLDDYTGGVLGSEVTIGRGTLGLTNFDGMPFRANLEVRSDGDVPDTTPLLIRLVLEAVADDGLSVPAAIWHSASLIQLPRTTLEV